MLWSKCAGCGDEFTYRPTQTKGKFCSNACQGLHTFRTVSLVKFERGELNERNTVVKAMKATREYKCELCPNDGTHNGKPLTLQVDHIDGNSDNNHPNNLRYLCPNCHSQTPTWKCRIPKDTRRSRTMRKYRSPNVA